MISCPNDTLSPVVVITSDAVQVDLILQEFVSVTSGMWSSVVMTVSGLVMLGVMGWRRFFGTSIDRLGRSAVFHEKAVKGLLGGAACRLCRRILPGYG